MMENGIKLLYVDDESLNLEVFKISMRKHFDIYTAESGFDGLSILSCHSDMRAVITDMRMPEMNGLEFIRLAKEKYPEICFFILTGYNLTDEISAALKSGLVAKYFQKPFDPDEIREIISALR